MSKTATGNDGPWVGTPRLEPAEVRRRARAGRSPRWRRRPRDHQRTGTVVKCHADQRIRKTPQRRDDQEEPYSAYGSSRRGAVDRTLTAVLTARLVAEPAGSPATVGIRGRHGEQALEDGPELLHAVVVAKVLDQAGRGHPHGEREPPARRQTHGRGQHQGHRPRISARSALHKTSSGHTVNQPHGCRMRASPMPGSARQPARNGWLFQ